MASQGHECKYGRSHNRRLVLRQSACWRRWRAATPARRLTVQICVPFAIIRELELQGFVRGVREMPKGRARRRPRSTSIRMALRSACM
jgi:hypothetical protein